MKDKQCAAGPCGMNNHRAQPRDSKLEYQENEEGKRGEESRSRDKCCQVSVVSAFIINKVVRAKAISIENQRKVKRNENP